jgi:galactokinase
MDAHPNESLDLVLDEPEVVASAPGRVEFIGNHTDYNGGWVLGATIDRRVEVEVERRTDRRLRMASADDVPLVEVGLDQIQKQTGDRSWANYVLGTIVALQVKGLAVDTGLNLRVRSALPVGAGLSSSAALELATAFAVTELVGGDLNRRTLAQAGRRAENDFVGVPCGILDQAVVAFGADDRLVRVDARTGQVTGVPFPSDTRLWIFRTHEAHSLADAHYQERFDEARAARRRLANHLGCLDHLVDVTPDQLEGARESLPEPLYRRARHVSTEHRRVKEAVRRLEEGDVEGVGDLLFESHESSRHLYENSTPELDFVVDRLAEIGPVLGARLTGAGFGGAAMAWTRASFRRAEATSVQEAYADRFGAELEVMACQPAEGVRVER